MKIELSRISRHAKALVLFLFAPLMSQAQTASSFYQPGVTTEGAVYFLPKTAVRVTVQVEKTTYTPGDFCKYAERYLRVKGVSPTPSVSYRITTIRQEAVAVADTSKRYAVESMRRLCQQCQSLQRRHPPLHQHRSSEKTQRQVLHACTTPCRRQSPPVYE